MQQEARSQVRGKKRKFFYPPLLYSSQENTPPQKTNKQTNKLILINSWKRVKLNITSAKVNKTNMEHTVGLKYTNKYISK